jgi:chromosomal replication initiation ATPase DnaA
MRKQFVPVRPAPIEPLPVEPEPPSITVLTERERIAACIRTSRELIAATPPGWKKLTLIVRAVAAVYGITPAEITGPSRLHRIVEPRHVGMAIAYQLLRCGTPAVGQAFGDRDHTCVLLAGRKFGAKIAAIIEEEGE